MPQKGWVGDQSPPRRERDPRRQQTGPTVTWQRTRSTSRAKLAAVQRTHRWVKRQVRGRRAPCVPNSPDAGGGRTERTEGLRRCREAPREAPRGERGQAQGRRPGGPAAASGRRVAACRTGRRPGCGVVPARRLSRLDGGRRGQVRMKGRFLGGCRRPFTGGGVGAFLQPEESPLCPAAPLTRGTPRPAPAGRHRGRRQLSCCCSRLGCSGGTVASLTVCALALDAAAWPPLSSGTVPSTGQTEATPAQPRPGNSY